MGGYSQPWDEKTGIPGVDDPGGFQRRRGGGLLAAMQGAYGSTPTETTPRTSESPRLLDRMDADTTRHPQGETYPEPDYSTMNMSSPGSTRSMSSDLDNWLKSRQAEYDQLSQPVERPPMSTKNKILRGIALAAPAAIGGIFGGGEGAAAGAVGSLQGYEQAQQRRQKQENIENARREQQQGRLLTDIGNVMRTREQEETADKRMTLQQQMEDQRERERQASQERLFGQQNKLEGTREAARDKTLKEQIDEQNKRQTAQFGEQDKLERMREDAADRREANREKDRSAKEDQKWQTVASKRYETAMDAEQRLSRMEASYKEATTKGDQQAMLALLSDHLGMTMGLQKGVRLNKDIIQEAQKSMPWLEKIGAKFDERGYLSGVTLGKDQMKQMLQLGYGARDRAVQGAYDESQLYGVAPPKGADAVFGKRKIGEMPALQQDGAGGKTATRQHIQEYARQKGISEQQAEKEFVSSGYKIQ